MFVKKKRRFWECTGCRLQLIIPLPSDYELQRYYCASYENGLYRTQLDTPLINERRAELRLQEILRFCRVGRWLDVGCSEGDFVATARRHGLHAEGIDLSETAVARARAKGLPVTCSTVSDHHSPLLYETVTAFDVIEHVRDPLAFLTSIWGLLVPGGTVVLSAPDLSSLSRVVMRHRWYFYIPEEHLFYFRRDSLSRLLSRTRFEVIWASATSKYVSYSYALDQFREYNPIIYSCLSKLSAVIPKSLRDLPLPFHLGELLIVARRRESDSL